MKEQHSDLTQGNILTTVLLFAIPILAGNLFQQLYSTVDAVIVGQFAGKNGLAAIDSVYSLLKLPVNFFTGLSTGATILISQFYGAKNSDKLHTTIHTAMIFSLAGGILLSIIGIFLAPQLLTLMEVPSDILPLTLLYVRIYFGGFAISMLYNIGAGILRAMGNSTSPFYALLISCIINIVLDLLFVAVFHWSVAGAAFATIIAQLVSALILLRKICGLDILRGSALSFHQGSLISILKTGLPIGLQSSLYPIANMLVQASINQTGTDNIAAWALCGKLDFLIWLSADAIATTIATFTAQNCGAQKHARARKAVGIGLLLSFSIVGAISAVLYFQSTQIGKLFISSADYDILPITANIMHALAPFYVIYIFSEIFGSAIRGTGETFKPMVLTLAGTCVTRILWILFAVPPQPDLLRILSCYPVSWIFTSLLMTHLYFKLRYSKKASV